ncbi:hypothetical protein BH09SUM1_BH09SUM1_31950 [soil metagenome]
MISARDLLTSLVDSPVKQAGVALLSTLFFEDPAVATAGLLIAEGKIHYWPTVIGMGAGITIADCFLYWLGWLFGITIQRGTWISPAQFDKAKDALERNLLGTVFLSRFLPGTRIPIYVGAGVLRAPFLSFLFVSAFAAYAWVFCLVKVSQLVGERILPLLGDMKWWSLGAMIVGLIIYKIIQMRKPKKESVTSFFEFWPVWFFYLPVGFYYLWLAVRFRGLTLPSIANPSIYASGLCRESKAEIMGLVAEKDRALIAPFVTHTKTDAPATEQLATAMELLRAAGISFPIIAKPDEGQRGVGVQRIEDEEALAHYIEAFPAGLAIILQQLVDEPLEAAILYCRKPSESRGRIISMTFKSFPEVTGDGRATLRDLIKADQRAMILRDIYFQRHAARLDQVPAAGEVVPLVLSGSHSQGAVYTDAGQFVTPELTAAVASVADGMREFYFARFDVRFSDLDAFQRGEHLMIFEINGAGAESSHVWDAKARLMRAYRALFRQWRFLFEIGAENRRRGMKTLPADELIRGLRVTVARSKMHPPAD